MISLNYFWFFVIAFTFSAALTRYGASNMEGSSPWLKIIAQIVGPLCDTALFIFLILGFWWMPHWWMPLVFFGVGIITQSILGLIGDIGNLIVLILGTIGAPLFTILAYLGMYNVI